MFADARPDPGQNGGAPVEAHGQFDGHPGQAALAAFDEAGVEGAGLGVEQGPAHPDAGGPEGVEAATGDLVGIGHGVHHLGNAGVDQRPGAGPGATLVVAGLEGDVGAGAPGQRARGGEGIDLGMGLAGAQVIALTHHPTVPGNHATHPGIGAGAVPAPAGQLQGAGHALPVEGGEGVAQGAAPVSRSERFLLSSLSSSARNSLMSWKLRYTEAKRT